MKKCLSPDDLMELSETQKSSLRTLWQPCKYDLALEIVWRDVENDLCEGIVLMIMDVGAIPSHTRYCEVVLKVSYLQTPPQYEYPESETGMEYSDEASTEPTETEAETVDSGGIEPEKSGFAMAPNGYYISKENCLPLLNIGQMIEILGKHKSELNINLTPEVAVCYSDGQEFEGDELCDSLWEMVKTLL